MNTELKTTYNHSPILDEYDNNSIKQIDDLLASIPQHGLTKFNFAPTSESKTKNFNNLFIGLLSSLLILCLCLGFFMMPLISGAAEILPINPNPSNEKLTVTSLRSSFYVLYNNKIYYSNNQNGVWTLDLGKIAGNDKLKVGTFIDFGLFKINSSKTEEFSFNRNYEVSTITTDIKKYLNLSKGEYKININSSEKYFKVTNGTKIIYETGANKNECKPKNENNTTILNCIYDFGTENKKLNFNLTIQDEYGNIKTLTPIESELVPINDFNCNTKSIYITSKINCVGNKNGKIIINTKNVIEYKANQKIDLPISLQEGNNKISIKMIDEHGFENAINLEFLFDKTPLSLALNDEGGKIKVLSNKDILNIEAKMQINYKNFITGKVSSMDISDRIQLLNSTISRSVETDIMKSEVSISKSELNNLKNLETFKDATLTFEFEDNRGKSITKTCEANLQEINNKYYLKFKC